MPNNYCYRISFVVGLVMMAGLLAMACGRDDDGASSVTRGPEPTAVATAVDPTSGPDAAVPNGTADVKPATKTPVTVVTNVEEPKATAVPSVVATVTPMAEMGEKDRPLRDILPTPTVSNLLSADMLAEGESKGLVSMGRSGPVGGVGGPSLPANPAGRGGEAGGENNPNDGLLPLVYFEGHGVNPFVDADEDPLSTFALDGDTASYEVGQLYLEQGALPPPDSVRVEEWVNAFDTGYDGVDEGLALRLDGMMSPFGEDGYRLLRVGVVAERPGPDRDPVSLIFVVDISGSMGQDRRLDVAKYVIRGLVGRLDVEDRVALVTYGDRGRVDHPMTSAVPSEDFVGRVLEMVPEGATNVEEGIVAAYGLAADERELHEGRNVRLVVLSDGVGNLGATGPDSVLEMVDQAAQRGAALTTVGVGIGGNYNDVMLEALANRGNGTYHYVRGLKEAADFLNDSAESVFRDVARDARVQVEFAPDVVRKYRLIGYENRAVADSSFRDDTLDFGELGFARDVTALYELRLEDGVDPDAELAVARLRWQHPDTGSVEEIEAGVTVGAVSGSVSNAPRDLVRVAAVAELAELLRLSYWAQCSSPADVVALLEGVEKRGEATAGLVALAKVADVEFEPYCDR